MTQESEQDVVPADGAVSWSDVQATAVAYLARREHSRRELAHKLGAKGFPDQTIASVLDALAQQNLQSDQRYAEQYVRLRAEKGYGPERIRAELRERGIDEADAGCGFAENREIDWFGNALRVRIRKFGAELPATPKDKAKQQRFLQYRGFGWDEIREALSAR